MIRWKIYSFIIVVGIVLLSTRYVVITILLILIIYYFRFYLCYELLFDDVHKFWRKTYSCVETQRKNIHFRIHFFSLYIEKVLLGIIYS